MKHKNILSIIIVCCFLTLGFCSCSVSARIKQADKRYNIGEYYQASEMYRQVFRQIDSKDKAMRAHVSFQQGECYRILNNAKAINAYKNAIRYHYE